MESNSTVQNKENVKIKIKSLTVGTSYRGFSSIDQEIEREIAMQWFTSSKTTYSQRNFLLKKDK